MLRSFGIESVALNIGIISGGGETGDGRVSLRKVQFLNSGHFDDDSALAPFGLLPASFNHTDQKLRDSLSNRSLLVAGQWQRLLRTNCAKRRFSPWAQSARKDDCPQSCWDASHREPHGLPRVQCKGQRDYTIFIKRLSRTAILTGILGQRACTFPSDENSILLDVNCSARMERSRSPSSQSQMQILRVSSCSRTVGLQLRDPTDILGELCESPADSELPAREPGCGG
jgi:hypothetical protein